MGLSRPRAAINARPSADPASWTANPRPTPPPAPGDPDRRTRLRGHSAGTVATKGSAGDEQRPPATSHGPPGGFGRRLGPPDEHVLGRGLPRLSGEADHLVGPPPRLPARADSPRPRRPRFRTPGRWGKVEGKIRGPGPLAHLSLARADCRRRGGYEHLHQAPGLGGRGHVGTLEDLGRHVGVELDCPGH